LDDQSQDRVRAEANAVLKILEGVSLGRWDSIHSEAVDLETMAMKDASRRSRVTRMAHEGKTRVWVDQEIVRRTQMLELLGFSRFDALHVACAEAAGADVLLTTDDSMVRRGRRVRDQLHVRVVNPLTWLQEVFLE
jgi:predicted nucleic acid-binding protein